ncbi:Gfo/Idh/MocA family protein [Chelativorans xinjiangense]|uniref:Gfo/Idh/MocA family protein n=1 Tax=Chelativorans xinjiangense TaxID=2681485 RepID=UPI0013571505|nr:Gfo/Idh/MocA family oxidoreductase [Chelativorans xinjiangense]
MTIRFAAIGLNHGHIYGQVDMLLRAGAELVSFHSREDDLAAAFAERYPDARRVADRAAILEDTSIALITSAAIPDERAGIAIAAMEHGKDVLLDKPGVTSLEQLEAVKRVQASTGRIFSILYSEHFESPATVKAGELVEAGAIGTVIHTVGLGPHSLRKPQRPGWFFERPRYGGILTDIASHQAEQFLFFTKSDSAEVLSATIANRANKDAPGLQDFGDMHLRSESATGYVRVDWFSPLTLPTWGDGRLTILGTEGYIEVRKNIDVAGREGSNHLFIVNENGVRHIDCREVGLPFGRAFLEDIQNRTETAMPQARCYLAMELALKAQALAERTATEG